MASCSKCGRIIFNYAPSCPYCNNITTLAQYLPNAILNPHKNTIASNKKCNTADEYISVNHQELDVPVRDWQMDEVDDSTHHIWNIGDIIAEHYILMEPVGKGIEGHIWKAKDAKASSNEQEALVALKRLNKNSSDISDEMLANYRLLQEYSHQYYSNYKTIVIHGEVKVLVMEFVSGKTLNKYLEESDEALPLAKVLHLGRQIAEGLDYAHDNGIVHGDIKPQNIMVLANDQIKIVDFGQAAAANRSSELADSYSNMAPERRSSQLSCEKKEDQYKLGLVLYGLLSGKFPSWNNDPTSLNNNILSSSPEPLDNLTSEQNTSLLRALAKNPECRFPNCISFMQDFADDQDMRAAFQGWMGMQPIKIRSKDKRGLTLMHLAAKQGITDFMLRLISLGENINAKDLKGKTPIFYSALAGHLDAIAWLKSRGADVNAKDKDGKTPMHYVAGRDDSLSMECLKN